MRRDQVQIIVNISCLVSLERYWATEHDNRCSIHVTFRKNDYRNKNIQESWPNQFKQIERFCNSPNSCPYKLLQGCGWLQVYSGLNTVHVYSTKQLRLQVYSGCNSKQLYSSLTAPSKLLATLNGKMSFCEEGKNIIQYIIHQNCWSYLGQAKCVHKSQWKYCDSPIINCTKKQLFFWLGPS